MDYEYSVIKPYTKPINFRNKIGLINWLKNRNIEFDPDSMEDICHYIGNNRAIVKINPCIKYNITGLYKSFTNPKRLHKFTYLNRTYYVYEYKNIIHVFIINRFGNTQELKRNYDQNKKGLYRFTIGDKKMSYEDILVLCGGTNEI